MKNNMTLLIMAAGNGSRYGALKQFDNLGPNKEFLFEFSVFDAISSGFDHIVIITKEEFVTEINDYLNKRLPDNVKIDVIAQRITELPPQVSKSFKREKPWGTAHAVWVARNYISNSFVVINADDYYGNGAFKKAAEFIQNKDNKNRYALVPYFLKETLSDYGTVSRGVCQANGDELIKLRELLKIERTDSGIIDHDSNTELTGEEPTSMNFWICNPSVFKEIETQLNEFLEDDANVVGGEVYIPLVIQKLVDDGQVSVKLTEASSSWFGVTYAEDKSNAIKVLKAMTTDKKYPSPLWKN